MNYICLPRVHHFVSLCKSISLNLPNIRMLLRYYYEADNYTHHHWASLRSSRNSLPNLFTICYLNILVYCDSPCNISNSWWSSCHLKFCMPKTKLIIYTPLDSVLKPKSLCHIGYSSLTSSCNKSLPNPVSSTWKCISGSPKAQGLIFPVLHHCQVLLSGLLGPSFTFTVTPIEVVHCQKVGTHTKK